MVVYRPKLFDLGNLPNPELSVSHRDHFSFRAEDFLGHGKKITEISKETGANAVSRSGVFEEAMLGALDKVSAHQQFASSLHEAAITDPDSVDVHDITIAQAQASMSLNITRNVLNRIVQSWRDLINTR